MTTLRVLAPFRDERNFFLLHKVGDELKVSDTDRVARLVKGGLCEVVDTPQAKAIGTQENKSGTLSADEQPEQPVKRQYRKRKAE